jgi:hypothetical protein
MTLNMPQACLMGHSCVTDQLFVRSREAPILMRICAGQACAEFARFSRLSATSGTTNR